MAGDRTTVMRAPRRRERELSEIIQVVLDDSAVDRLRETAEAMEVELEQLIVLVLHAASRDPQQVLRLRDRP